MNLAESGDAHDRASKAARNWAEVRRLSRLYRRVLLFPVLLFFWFAGYGLGLIHGSAGDTSGAQHVRKESIDD